MPDARREFKAILEAIVVVVSWRRRQTRNLKLLTPRPINSHVFTSTFSVLYILPRWVYSYNSDLCEKDRTQMTDSAMPCLALAALLYHDGERLIKYSASLVGFTTISS
jgi:hypothetical protein